MSIVYVFSEVVEYFKSLMWKNGIFRQFVDVVYPFIGCQQNRRKISSFSRK